MTTPQGGTGFNLGSAMGFIDLDTTPIENAVNRASSALDRLRNAGGSLQSIGSNISGFGAQLTAFTAPFAAGIGAGVKVAADFDAALIQIQSRAGLTDEALNLVREQALQLGADTIFSTQDAADSFLQLLTAGLNAEEAMSALPAILDGAAASGADLGQTADLVTNVLTSFNLEADQAARVVDLMARGAGASPATMAQMGEALQDAGGLAREFGMSIEDTSAMMAIFAQNGIRGTEASTQLRSLMTNMTSPTENTARAWEMVGTSLFDAQGQVRDFDTVLADIRTGMAGLTDEQRAFVTQNLAGSYGRIGFNALLASDGIGAMNATMAEQTAATDIAQSMMSSFQGSVMSVVGSVQSLAITALTPFMNNVLKPLLGDNSSGVIGVINNLRVWASENEGLVTKVLTFISILAAAGPVLFIVGQAISFIGFVLAFLTSPIGLIIALVALLAAAWMNNWGGMRDFVNNSVMPLLMSFFNWLGGVWTNTIQPGLALMWDWFMTSGLPAISNFVTGVVLPAIVGFFHFLRDAWLMIGPGLGLMFDWFMTTGLPLLKDFVLVTVLPAIQSFFNFLRDAWVLIGPGLGLMFDWFMTTGLPLVRDFIANTVKPTVQGFIDLLVGIWNTVSPHIDSLKNGMETAFNFIKNNVIDPVVNTINSFIDTFNSAKNLASTGLSFVGDAASGAANFVGGLFGGSRDSGGDGQPGRSYLIGTGAQPELFTPSTSGTFTPADQLGKTFNISIGNINASGYAEGQAAGRGFADGFLEKVRANG